MSTEMLAQGYVGRPSIQLPGVPKQGDTWGSWLPCPYCQERRRRSSESSRRGRSRQLASCFAPAKTVRDGEQPTASSHVPKRVHYRTMSGRPAVQRVELWTRDVRRAMSAASNSTEKTLKGFSRLKAKAKVKMRKIM